MKPTAIDSEVILENIEQEFVVPLPQDWIVLPLKELAENKNSFFDGDWILSENLDPNGTIRLIQLSDIGEGLFLDKSSRHISEDTFNKLKCTELKSGDLLISRMADPIARSCILPCFNYKCITAVDIAVIRCNQSIVNPKFLNYMCNTPEFTKTALNYARGTTRIRITRKNLGELFVPIPPLPEQQRIVDRIENLFEKLDHAKELAQNALEQFERRKAAILHKAFMGELTKEWRLKNNVNLEDWNDFNLSEVCVINPPKADIRTISDETDVSFIPMPAVSDIYGVINSPQVKKLSEVKKGYTNFSENDVLFAKITPCMENGKAAIVGNLVNNLGYGSTEFFVFRCSNKLEKSYLYHLIRSKKFRDESKAKMTGAVGQLRVPKSFLENYNISLPPIEEQKKIVQILDSIFKTEEQAYELISIIEKIDLMKKSILSCAFRGELGTNNPSE